MKLGTVGIPAYHAFSLEELEEATNGFDTSTFMGEGSHGQVHSYFLMISGSIRYFGYFLKI